MKIKLEVNNLLLRFGFFLALIMILGGCGQVKMVESGYVLFIGDSLTSSSGEVDPAYTYPAILSERWERESVNISQPGLKATGALEWVEEEVSKLKQTKGSPCAVFIALGANDQLGGVEPERAADSLKRLIQAGSEMGGKVFLIRCIVPIRSRGYNNMYQQLADDTNSELSPDIIGAYFRESGGREGDGVHPTKLGHRAIADCLGDNFRRFFKQ